MVISDNGASAEGGPTGTTNEAQFFNNAQEPIEESLKVIDEIGGPKHFNHYPWGWTWAGNTPFRRWKRETYRGGVSDPFIVSWPKGIKAKGEVRTQYAHIIDMVPTVLDLLGIEPPATIRGVTQAPLHGVSFAQTLDDPEARTVTTRSTSRCSATARSTTTAGGRSAPGRARRSPRPATASVQAISAEKLSKLDATGWELYHVAEDFAETRNVAAENRDKLIAMIGTWYVEAGKYDVMPIDGSGLARMVAEKPLIALPRDRYTYLPNTQSVPNFAAPKVLNRPHSITADVEIPEAGAEGVLLCQGTAAGGYSFYIKDGKLRYVHNYVGRELLGVESDNAYRGEARAPLRVRANRAARHAARQGRTRAGCSSTSTANWSATPKPPLQPRSCSTPARSPAEPTPAPRSPPTTHARSPSPARSTASRSTSAASSSTILRRSCARTWHGNKGSA